MTLTFVDQVPTLVYVLSPLCSWCERNHANMVALAASKKATLRVVGVAVSGTQEQLQAHLDRFPLPFPVYRLGSDRLAAQLDMALTPQTLIVDSEGVVTAAWAGALFDDRLLDVERTLGVSLPGLPDPN